MREATAFFVAVHCRVRHRRRRRRVVVAGCASVLAVAVGAATVAAAGDVDRTDQDPVVTPTADTTRLPDVDTTKLPDFASATSPSAAADAFGVAHDGVRPMYDGRLAHYVYAEHPQSTENIVWDLSTGRAARLSIPAASSATSGGGGATSWPGSRTES